MSRLVIVGGSDAGISAGLRARQVDPGTEPLLVVADAFPNFSICGIPYHVSGDVPDWRDLAHRTRADLEAAGLDLRLDTTARRIDPHARTVTVTGSGGREETIGYDRLVIGTGATPVRPPIAGLDRLGPADGVHLLHTMADTFALTAGLDREPTTALIVGAGYIGLEVAEALHARGLQVTMAEQLPQVLPTVDAELAALVEEELARHGVLVRAGVTVTAVANEAGGLTVVGHATGDRAVEFTATVDLVLVVVGVRPDTALAQTAGVELGVRRAIAVDRRMRTTVPSHGRGRPQGVLPRREADHHHRDRRRANGSAAGCAVGRASGHGGGQAGRHLRHGPAPRHDGRRGWRLRPVVHAAAGQPVGRGPGRGAGVVTRRREILIGRLTPAVRLSQY